MPFIPQNVSSTLSESLSNSIREKLVNLNVERKRGSSNLVVLNREQIQQALGEEKLQQSCDAFQCVSDAGAKLKADKIIIGMLNYRYGTYYIVLKAVDLGYKEEGEAETDQASETQVAGGKIESALAFKVKASGEKLEREFDKIADQASSALFSYYTTH
jgi:hypothetical protein